MSSALAEPPVRPRPNARVLVPLLVIMSMIGPLTLNILQPAMPGLVATFETSRDMVQLTLSLFLGTQAFAQLALGPLADRFGRRPVLIWSIGLFVSASLFATFARSIEMLILARIFQAIGATAGLTLGRTIIRDIYDQSSAASMIGYVTMAMVVAPMAAPSIGAVLDTHFGWPAIFGLCATMGMAALALIIPNLPETRPLSIQSATIGDVASRSFALLGKPVFLTYSILSASASAMFFAILGAAPYLVIDVMGLSGASYGLWFIFLSGGYMLGNFTSGSLARTAGTGTLIQLGNIAGIVGALIMVALALVPVLHPAALFLPAMIISFANGLTLPNAIAASIGVDPAAAGAASGLSGAMQMGMGAIATYVAGQMASASTLPVALMVLFFAVAAFLMGGLTRSKPP